MMMNGMGMMMWGVFSFLLGLLLILFFVLVVVAVVKWLWGRKLPFVVSDRENALEILKRRYAKGEIGKEEFNLFAATGEQVFRSTDGGKNWEKIL